MLRNHWVCLAAGTAIGGLAGATLVSATDSGLVMLGTDGRLQWETLLTGAVALGAAWGTIRAVRDQIRQSDKQAQDRRDRQARAARAVLPLALAELVHYARACLTWLKTVRDASGTEQSVDCVAVARAAVLSEVPSLPDPALPVLKDCIAAADGEAVDALIALSQFIQIQHSRFSDLVAQCRSPSVHKLLARVHFDDRMIDAAVLGARCGSLMFYARRLGPPAILSGVDVVDFLFRNDLDQDEYPDVHRRAESWTPD